MLKKGGESWWFGPEMARKRLGQPPLADPLAEFLPVGPKNGPGTPATTYPQNTLKNDLPALVVLVRFVWETTAVNTVQTAFFKFHKMWESDRGRRGGPYPYKV